MLASQQTNDERSESRADTPQLAAGSFIGTACIRSTADGWRAEADWLLSARLTVKCVFYRQRGKI